MRRANPLKMKIHAELSLRCAGLMAQYAVKAVKE